MIEWRFVIPVIEPMRWTAETETLVLQPVKLIQVEVHHGWVAYDDTYFQEGHRLAMRWHGESFGDETRFVTQHAFESAGQYTFWRQPIGHNNLVLVSIDKPREDLGDNPLDVAAFRVSLQREDGGEARHVKRSGTLATMFSPYKAEPKDPCNPTDIDEAMRNLLGQKREEE